MQNRDKCFDLLTTVLLTSRLLHSNGLSEERHTEDVPSPPNALERKADSTSNLSLLILRISPTHRLNPSGTPMMFYRCKTVKTISGTLLTLWRLPLEPLKQVGEVA